MSRFVICKATCKLEASEFAMVSKIHTKTQPFTIRVTRLTNHINKYVTGQESNKVLW